ncbi:NAD(P)-dependent oxidoreductase [Streptomyces sp. NPDC056231]|uniref:NAD(P)-dependent oxidoreductase n=1 Tax=Streptomyces sp. NPDC056231 TaxID=3345755 RepID=UPI003AAC9AB7
MTDSTNRPTIGWAGTGRMGYAMVSRLLRAGHDVTVYNRTRSKCEPLSELGATIVDSAAELADRDIVFTMVSASKDFAEVTLGEQGILRQSAKPRILVDSSTVSQEVSAQVRKEAEKAGTALLVAPVSGNAKVVKAGRLSTVVSGPREVFDEVEPLLGIIAASVTYAGRDDVARLVKLAHNIFLGVVAQSMAEITVLAEKGGVSRAAFLDFLNGSVLGSVFTRYKTPAFVKLDFTPTFTPQLLRKDFDLGLAAARELEVPMPVAALTHQIVQQSVGRGHDDTDFAVLLMEAARSAGLTLVPEDADVSDGLSTAS